jgi:hypothetical protein
MIPRTGVAGDNSIVDSAFPTFAELARFTILSTMLLKTF